jgi:hypothetical protein
MLKSSLASAPVEFAVQLPRELRVALIACAVTLVLGTAIASVFTIDFIHTMIGPQFVGLADYLFRTQDRLWLMLVALLLLCFALLPVPIAATRLQSIILRKPRITVIALVLAVLIIGVAGADLVFQGYHLSRDEVLAEFDALVFRSGRFVAPIAAPWQPFASALEPYYMLPLPNDVGAISTYLPVNAGFRALVGLIADDVWTNPLLAVCAVLATFGVARRLWPTRLDAAFISALLVATSSQVLILSMTSYAMTAHLALNMIWLWFFLRNDKIGHGAAIATGFFACGLHQLLFHPLFVLPFILRLWQSKRHSLALVYVASYAAIALFWVDYWNLVLTAQGVAPQNLNNTGLAFFIVRAFVFANNLQWAGLDLTLKNVLRLVAWQNPAIIPLALLAYPAIRTGSGIARELMIGLLLTLIVMFVLTPFQGHGWGYRYLHGLIGSAAILAGYGWVTLTNRITQNEVRACHTMFAAFSLFATLALLPAHALQAHDFVAPYAKASKAIQQSPADVVIVDSSRLFYAEDLVRNDPFLRNHPKVLDLSNLTEPNIVNLCTHYRVAIFDYDQAPAVGIRPNDQLTKVGDDKRATAREMLAQHACRIEQVVQAKQLRPLTAEHSSH